MSPRHSMRSPRGKSIAEKIADRKKAALEALKREQDVAKAEVKERERLAKEKELQRLERKMAQNAAEAASKAVEQSEAPLHSSIEDIACMNGRMKRHKIHRKTWCCIKNAALRREPELDSEKLEHQLEAGTCMEARHGPSCY